MPGRQYSGAGAALNVLGMTAITGSEETWLVECHQPFDGIESLDKRLAAVAPRVTGDPSDLMPDDVLPPARTLIAFYRNVRPWGFWGPIHRKVVALYPDFQENRNFRRDMFNVVVGTMWQTSLVLLPMYVVLLKWRAAALVVGIIVLTSGILKKSWYDALGKEAASEPIKPSVAGGGLGAATD